MAESPSGELRQVSRHGGGGVDQDSLTDGGEPGQQLTDEQVQGLAVMEAVSVSTLSRERRVLPRARVAASSSSFRPALARVVPTDQPR
jgi:hypothetical protein